MASCSRRAAVGGTVSLLVSGCLGPVTEQGTIETVPPNESDDDLSEAERETLVTVLEDTLALYDRAAATFSSWKRDPGATDVETFDTLRADATRMLSRFWDEVLAHEAALRELDREWAGSGNALADLLPQHEAMLRRIEDASIALVDAEGDPARVPASSVDTIDYVIEESPELSAATERALPD